LASELAACGAAGRAIQIVADVADPQAEARILAQAVDIALAQGPAGRALLPQALHDQFDRVLQAFRLQESGADEQALKVLGDVGLQSPFLEWRLLLRGLLAYYRDDAARAVEIWQRLSPERLPAKLAGPLRF